MQVESGVSTEIDVATRALMNPLVLNQIFSYLDAPTLKKSVRPVCTLWADLGAPFLAKRTTVTFSVDAQCGIETPEIKWLTSFHPKLAKNVKLAVSSCPCYWSEILPEKFVAVLPQIAHGLEELEVKIGSSFLPGLHKMWTSHRFKNLTRISLAVMISYDQNYGRQLTPCYPLMPNLRTISITVVNQYQPYQDEMTASISQKLLNSAPNLAEVEAKVSFYLDFAPCKKLDKVAFTFIQFLDFNSDEVAAFVNMDKTADMLDPCRKSLTELSLSRVGAGDEDHLPQILSLPSFPNLTRLTISCLDGGNHLGDCLYTTHLPNLTHVALASRDYCSLSELFQHFRRPHVGIRSLHVTAEYNVDEDNVATAAEIVRLFPAVTTFQVKLTLFDDMEDEDDNAIFKETLQSFAPWGLTEALVEMKDVPNSGVVSTTMQALVGWRGLGQTEVRLCGAAGSVFVLGDAVKATLLACRGVKSVKMSGFVIKKRDEFQEFIEENGLRISLSE